MDSTSVSQYRPQSRQGIGAAFRYVAPACFFLSLLAIAFAGGVAVARWELFPYRILDGAARAASDWLVNGAGYLRGDPVNHTRPARYPGAGVTTSAPERMAPGLTLMTGVWRDGRDWFLGARLVAGDGAVAHEWRTDPSAVWPETPHRNVEKDLQSSKDRLHIHGAELLPDGRLVLNFEYLGLVGFDACGGVLWKLAHRTHHSVHHSHDGTFWVPGRQWVEDSRHPGLPVPHADDTVLQVSPDGRILREISILDAIYRSGYQGLLFATRQDKPIGSRDDNEGDLLRLNDVETLEPEMTAAFPMFAAGDIMVSLRQINTILVLDGGSGLVKWSMSHPLIRQHDPDFNPDGTITVFDNRKDDTPDGRIFGGSRIVRIDPASRTFTVAYPTGPTDPVFFTNTMGKHQVLANGNILIAETEAGRAVEVTAAGETVWAYVNRWNEGRVGLLEQSTRYPPGSVAFPFTSCRR